MIAEAIKNGSTVNSNTSDHSQLKTEHYVAICLYTVYGVTAVVGNIILIIAMKRAQFLRIGGYLTLAHLAVSDIITGLTTLVVLPWCILFQKDIFHSYIPALVIVYGSFVRKVLMIFMAGIMFWSIIFPLSARQHTSVHWYRKALTIVWLTSCLASFPYWIGNGVYPDGKSYKWTMNTNYVPKYGFVSNVAVTVVILLVYPLCIFKIFKNNLNRHNSETSLVHKSVFSKHNRTLLILFIISSVIYVLYWVLIYTCELYGVKVPYYGLWKETMRGILTSYSPFLYCFIHKKIRLSVVSLICCQNNSKRTSSRVIISAIPLGTYRLENHIFPFNS